MKKEILSMLMVASLLAGGAALTFGADTAEASTKKFGTIYSILTEYINKYIQEGCLPGNQDQESDRPESGDQDQEDQEQEDQNQGTSSSTAAQVLAIVNSERSQEGLRSLSSDSDLNKLAQMKAEDMAKNGYFSHNSPTYGSAFDMMNEYGFSYRTAGENIAKGQKTAASVMQAWMNSPGHRANILGEGYTKLGVGYAVDSKGTPYWVQMFAG